MLIVAITALLAVLRRRLLCAAAPLAEGPTWDCGYAAPTARMQYTASSFAWPILDMFRWLVRPRLQLRIDEGRFPAAGAPGVAHRRSFPAAYFAPLFRAVARLADGLHWLQQGRNQLYVLYIAVTVLVLLLLKVR